MVLRSDERANEAEVERDRNFRGNVRKGVSSAASLAGGAASGALAAKVMPFINQYIPAGLAMKGISKVSPKLGAFLQKGHEMGMDVEEGLTFIKDKLGGNKQEPAKQNGNIIEQYSPNLFQYMKDLIGKGGSPIEAAAKARKFLDKKEQDIISKMEKDHKTDWSSIVESVFGGQGMAQPQPQQGQQQQPGPQGQPQQSGQAGPGSQKLMSILDMINQKLGQ